MSYPKPTKKPLAIWRKAFPKQAKRLRPEGGAVAGIKFRSGSEAARMAVYNGILEFWNKLHPYCDACQRIYMTHRVGNPNLHAQTTNHHKKGRDGLLLFDVRHFLPCCLWSHRWIDANKDEARSLGLLAAPGEWNKQETGA